MGCSPSTNGGGDSTVTTTAKRNSPESPDQPLPQEYHRQREEGDATNVNFREVDHDADEARENISSAGHNSSTSGNNNSSSSSGLCHNNNILAAKDCDHHNEQTQIASHKQPVSVLPIVVESKKNEGSSTKSNSSSKNNNNNTTSSGDFPVAVETTQPFPAAEEEESGGGLTATTAASVTTPATITYHHSEHSSLLGSLNNQSGNSNLSSNRSGGDFQAPPLPPPPSSAGPPPTGGAPTPHQQQQRNGSSSPSSLRRSPSNHSNSSSTGAPILGGTPVKSAMRSRSSSAANNSSSNKSPTTTTTTTTLLPPDTNHLAGIISFGGPTVKFADEDESNPMATMIIQPGKTSSSGGAAVDQAPDEGTSVLTNSIMGLVRGDMGVGGGGNGTTSDGGEGMGLAGANEQSVPDFSFRSMGTGVHSSFETPLTDSDGLVVTGGGGPPSTTSPSTTSGSYSGQQHPNHDDMFQAGGLFAALANRGDSDSEDDDDEGNIGSVVSDNGNPLEVSAGSTMSHHLPSSTGGASISRSHHHATGRSGHLGASQSGHSNSSGTTLESSNLSSNSVRSQNSYRGDGTAAEGGGGTTILGLSGRSQLMNIGTGSAPAPVASTTTVITSMPGSTTSGQIALDVQTGGGKNVILDNISQSSAGGGAGGGSINLLLGSGGATYPASSPQRVPSMGGSSAMSSYSANNAHSPPPMSASVLGSSQRSTGSNQAVGVGGGIASSKGGATPSFHPRSLLSAKHPAFWEAFIRGSAPHRVHPLQKRREAHKSLLDIMKRSPQEKQQRLQEILQGYGCLWPVPPNSAAAHSGGVLNEQAEEYDPLRVGQTLSAGFVRLPLLGNEAPYPSGDDQEEEQIEYDSCLSGIKHSLQRAEANILKRRDLGRARKAVEQALNLVISGNPSNRHLASSTNGSFGGGRKGSARMSMSGSSSVGGGPSTSPGGAVISPTSASSSGALGTSDPVSVMMMPPLPSSHLLVGGGGSSGGGGLLGRKGSDISSSSAGLGEQSPQRHHFAFPKLASVLIHLEVAIADFELLSSPDSGMFALSCLESNAGGGSSTAESDFFQTFFSSHASVNPNHPRERTAILKEVNEYFLEEINYSLVVGFALLAEVNFRVKGVFNM